MTTKTTKTEKPADQPKRQTTRAADHFDAVAKVIRDAGPEGLSMKAIEDLTGIRYRVLSNVVYHLTKDERIRRVGEGRRLQFASTEVKAKPAPRKRAPRKTAPASKKAATSKAA